MGQLKIVDGCAILMRTGKAVMENQMTCYFSDGSSLYCQFFSDGVVLTGYFNSSGKWFFAGPEQVSAFFNLAGDQALDSRTMFVDGHEACVLQKSWDSLCGSQGK